MSDPIAASTIAAQAFRVMEMRPISSFADDSPQAADAAEQYPLALKRCLESYDWDFARKLADLPLSDDEAVADPDLPYIYRLPEDCVALRLIYGEGVKHRSDSEFLYADQSAPLKIRYTARITDEARLPSGFSTAVSFELAVRLSPRWVSTRTKRADLESQRNDALIQARRRENRTASDFRLDGRDVVCDWATEATH